MDSNQTNANNTPNQPAFDAEIATNNQSETCAGCRCSEPVDPLETDIGIKVDQLINIDSLKDNTVIVLRIGDQLTSEMMLAIQMIGSRYGEILHNKGCTVMLLNDKTQIETLSEEEMGKKGWQKKGLIVTPGSLIR